MSIYPFLTTRNLLFLDYPVEACLRSLTEVLEPEKILIADDSTDGTLDLLLRLQKELPLEIHSVKFPQNKLFWAAPKQYLLDLIPEDAYVYAADADEVLHEEDKPNLQSAIASKSETFSLPFLHFIGKPTCVADNPLLWYSYHTRMWKKSTGIFFYTNPQGCADDLIWPDGTKAHLQRFVRLDATVYHYGHLLSPKAMAHKMWMHHTFYNRESPAEPTEFTYHLEGTREYTGSHPKFASEWLARHTNQPLAWRK